MNHLDIIEINGITYKIIAPKGKKPTLRRVWRKVEEGKYDRK